MSLTNPWGLGCLGVAGLVIAARAVYDGYKSTSKGDEEGDEGVQGKVGQPKREGQLERQGQEKMLVKTPAS